MRTVFHYPRILLTLIAVVALLPGIFQLPLMDRDEPRFSHATIEMMDRGEWVVPYFNGEYRFDKPPLTYWWMRLHYSVFGKHEFAARLHSTFSAWLIALAMFSMAKQMGLSSRRALLSGAMWLCCMQVLIHGRMAVADMPLILFLVLSQWSQWRLLMKSDGKVFSSPWFWMFHLSVGLGFLAKGPLAYIIPLLTLAVYAVLVALGDRSHDRGERLRSIVQTLGVTLVGVPISLGMVALWGIPAMIQTDYQYFDVGIGTHVVERGTGAMNDRDVVPGIYFLYMLPFLLPWSGQLTSAVKQGITQEEIPTAGRYLLAWFIVPFLIFSFYATQLPHYILPGYPAFMILLASVIGVKRNRSMFGKILGSFAVSLAWIFAIAALIGCLLCPTTGEVAPMKGLFGSLTALFMFLGLGGIVVVRNSPSAGAKALCFALLASLMMIPAGYYGRQAHMTVRMMPYLSADRDTTRAAWGFQEGTLTWYPSDFWLLGHPHHTPGFADCDEMVLMTKRWRIDDDFLEDLQEGAAPAPVDNRVEQVNQMIEEFGVEKVATLQGWNPGQSSWVEVVIAKKKN